MSSEREHRDPSRAARDEQARRLRRVRLVLATVALAALAHVLLAEDPWSSGAVARVDLRGFTVQGDAIPFVWCASLLLAPVAGALALGAGRWLGPLEVEETPAFAPRPRVSRAFVLAVAGAVCVCAALAVPRLDLGMWDDEIYSARHSMVGRYRMAGDEARFVPVGWRETLWHYRMPNNHVPYSLAARVVAKGWLAALRPAERLRIEVPLRLPALLFGLAAIVATALLLLRLGFPAAGAVTAWILALHPWHVRYASEARGYALVLLLVPLLCLALVAVLRRGCWRHWIAFGGLQLLLLWTWPAALPVLVLANLVLVAVQARRARGVALRVQAVRQAVVGIAGAALFLELMLPNLIQLVGYTAWKQRGAMGLSWWREVAAHLLAGTPWRHRLPQAIAPELAALFDASPAGFTALAVLATGAVLLGAARLANRHGTLGLGLVAIFLLSPPLVVGLAALRETFLHAWYMVFALPGLAMLAALGIDGALSRAVRRIPPRARLAVTGGVLVGLALGFAWLTWPMHAAMRAHPFSPQRDAVLATRPSLDPNAPENRRILTVAIQAPPKYYDPRCEPLETEEELLGLMARADAEGLPLFVNTGRLDLAARRRPELLALVRRPDLFEPPQVTPALVPRLTRHVYRYRPQRDARVESAAACSPEC